MVKIIVIENGKTHEFEGDFAHGSVGRFTNSKGNVDFNSFLVGKTYESILPKIIGKYAVKILESSFSEKDSIDRHMAYTELENTVTDMVHERLLEDSDDLIKDITNFFDMLKGKYNEQA